MAKRKSISKKQRFEVFKRDSFSCQYCGRKPPDVLLECDHIQPICEGGSDSYENLITSCFDCNRGKSGNSLADSDCDAVQQLQLEKIAQLSAFNEMLIDASKANDRHIEWLVDKVAGNMDWTCLNKDEQKSIRCFARRLSFEEILEESEIAGSKRIPGNSARWRYFCGICWSKVKESQS